jgi:hypothetical protein
MVRSLLGELAGSPSKGGWAEILISIVTLKYHSLYLFPPWMFPGIIGLPALIIVPLLTYFGYRRSRVAAVLLLFFYVLIKAFMFIWLYVYSGLFVAIWVAISILWGYVFFQGVRGTFVHHKMACSPNQPRLNGTTWVNVAHRRNCRPVHGKIKIPGL